MHPMLTIAVRAARKAGNFILKNYEIPDVIERSHKDSHNFVTNINRDAEHLIIEVIRKSYPKHTILTEERGEVIDKNDDVQWMIDPLNSVSNFIKGFPHFSVSIAAQIKGRTEIAVVYDPMRNELFTASRGQGAQLNGYRLRGNHAKDLDRAILAIGFSLKHTQYNAAYINIIRTLFTQCAEFRLTGSCALDLAYVAAGRIDGLFEINLKPWSFMAGELLVRESGGVVSDFIGGHNYFHSGNAVASNPRIIKTILSTLRLELNKFMKN